MLVFLVFFSFFDFLGYFFYLESVFNFYLFFLSVITYFLLMLINSNFLIKNLVLMLVFISFGFFFIWNYMYFFIFFELSSIPVIIITLIWGSQVEKLSSIYFLLFYSFLIGFPFLFILMFLKMKFFFNFMIYLKVNLNFFYLFFLMMMFLMKFPIYFLHFWLPKMHVESSTLGSMLLAGLLLKFGTFGLSRILFLFNFFNPFFLILLMFLGLIFSLFLSLMQSDSKSQIAYLSISHMSLIIFFYLTLSGLGKVSSILMMMGHGLISPLIFWVTGEIFHLTGTRLVYFMNSFFLSNIFITYFLIYIMFSGGSAPFSLSFFSEIFLFYFLDFYSFFIMFFSFYFYLDFFISIFTLINFMMGKKVKLTNYNGFTLIVIFLLVNFSFFMLFI